MNRSYGWYIYCLRTSKPGTKKLYRFEHLQILAHLIELLFMDHKQPVLAALGSGSVILGP